MVGKQVECRIAMRPGKRRQLPATPEGRLQEFCEKAKAHIRAKVEHPFRVLKQQLSFTKTRLRGLEKNRSTLLVLAAPPGDAVRHRRRDPAPSSPIRPIQGCTRGSSRAFDVPIPA